MPNLPHDSMSRSGRYAATSIAYATSAIRSIPRPENTGATDLQRGAHVPPLILDDDESVAVAVGLRYAAEAAIGGIEETSLARADEDRNTPAPSTSPTCVGIAFERQFHTAGR